ncbi:metallophosphoesterase [Paraburkholderia sp. BR14263]|uniref:metallophosphoesterase family protein n=1 Tax=unclassified Paraburkholderia TaxID=2615204 RepID=UPI0034CDD131
MFAWRRNIRINANEGMKPGDAPTTVMHVSDLHFGLRFDNILWKDVVRRAVSIKPDVIVVTGDVVNTPWRLAVRRAGDRLIALREKLRIETGKKHLEIFVVPGNHDTRISGLFPIQWLLPAAIISAVIAATTQRWYPFDGAPWLPKAVEAVFWSVCAAGVLLRLATTRKLGRGQRQELFISHARVLNGMNVGVIPFDSASEGIRWAAGKVKRGALGAFRDVASAFEPVDESLGIFWIAAVHHHPVPLPYDAGNETMMIMTNAGKFLHELASYGVPLVLHGHKHHQHFSKLSFQTPYSTQSEIAILSASTPTEKNGAGAFRHGFNVIHVNEEHQAMVSVYSAQPTGETFVLKKTFSIAESSEMARRRFETYLARKGVVCQRAVFTAVVDEFGGAVITRRFHGFESMHAPLSLLPGKFELSCHEGHVGEVVVKPISEIVPHMTVREAERSVTKVVCTVEFEGSLLSPRSPVDFELEVAGSNLFALDIRQFEELYNDPTATVEEMIWTVPEGLAIRELQLHLKFLSKTVHPSQIRLSRAIEKGQPWRPCDEHISFVQGDSSAAVTILHPQPNGRYRLTWRPPEAPREASDILRGRSRAARERLLFATDEQKARVREWLPLFAQYAGEQIFDTQQNSQVHAAVFSYSSKEKRLQIVASTYAGEDPRRQWSFGYGRGIVGATFKLNQIAGFDKTSCDALGYTHYLRGDGQIAACASDVPEGGAYAFPLRMEDSDRNQSKEPFGVLLVSVDGWGGQLATLQAPTADAENPPPDLLGLLASLASQEVLNLLEHAILTNRTGEQSWKKQRRRISSRRQVRRRKKASTNFGRTFTRR